MAHRLAESLPGRTFWLVDTGGLVPESDDSMDRAIRQSRKACASSATRCAIGAISRNARLG